MYCPRCGTPNDPGDKFCSACGAALQATGKSRERASLRGRAGGLIGKTPRARLLSALTALFLAIAVAFVVLQPAEDDAIPRDAYTISADRLCLSAKRQIVAVERAGRKAAPSVVARALLPVVADWRSEMQSLRTPADRAEKAQQLDSALGEVEIRIAALARIAAQGSRRQALASAERADAASTAVEDAVSALGLSDCAHATIGLAPDSG